jgi:hypothetical protein
MTIHALAEIEHPYRTSLHPYGTSLRFAVGMFGGNILTQGGSLPCKGRPPRSVGMFPDPYMTPPGDGSTDPETVGMFGGPAPW